MRKPVSDAPAPGLGFFGFHQGNDKPAEAAAGQARARGTQVQRGLHQDIDLRHRHRVVVPLRGMAADDQVSEAGRIAGLQGGKAIQDPLVFRHNVAGALAFRIVDPCHPGQVLNAQVAELGDAQGLAGTLAFVDPLGITAVGQLVGDTGYAPAAPVPPDTSGPRAP